MAGVNEVHYVVLAGHLTVEVLSRALAPIDGVEGPAALIFDALTMTSYDNEARGAFVEWHSRHRKRFSRVAIVTQKMLWRTVIAAMALASKQPLHAFSTVEEAAHWVRRP